MGLELSLHKAFEGKFMATQNVATPNTKAIVYAGAVAGIIAGIGMAVVAMIISAARGDSALTPVYLIGATFMGSDAVVGGAGPFIVGLITHLVVSAVLGILFEFLKSF